MKLTKAEIGALQRAERYRDAAKRAISADGDGAEITNNLACAGDWYSSLAQMIAVRVKKVTA